MDLVDETGRKSPWRMVDEWDLRHRVWLEVLVVRGDDDDDDDDGDDDGEDGEARFSAFSFFIL